MASRTDTTAAADDPVDSVAAALSSASFVRLLASADGDGLAAAGLLARALRRVDVPFQVRVDALGAGRPSSGDDGLFVGVGSAYVNADATVAPETAPASLRASRIAAEVGGTDAAAPDPVLALAGVVADGAHPASVAGELVAAAEDAGSAVQRPGVSIPVDDAVDGLTHSTLLHAPFSGDHDAAAAAVSSLSRSDNGADSDSAADTETRRSLASRVALAVAGDNDAVPRAADAVERAVRPYTTPDAPVATLGGFADVLTATARERPGTGVALALGHGGRDAALDAWREHGRTVHSALDSASTTRHDGVFVARVDEAAAGTPGRLATLARLARDFRSPEPLVVAVGDGIAATSARESGAADAAATLAAEFPAAAVGWTGGPTRALAGIATGTPVPEMVAAIRRQST
ncbi:hypothetical protein GCM10008995_18540 [Halobellus salinus]|uniref:Exonuclease RecJ n=1 Tax=Halobellus salinus TaxID=931585 RepID=A0A830EPI3_9EURY|nr:hypothetical protein [Halobellus salinus]GGJ08942.1 hypothetical protein GCM10008995_18540 [Halobellus salinus]SMP27071.1 hypothetical protein SAMN06265347_11226 [Halobellus salinus]